MLEVHANFARNIIVGFARFSGVVVGIVANQPMVMAGALDLDAADKVAHFIRDAQCVQHPLVTLVDVPVSCPASEENAVASSVMAQNAFAFASYPQRQKSQVILRKSYGSYRHVQPELGADMVFAWPTAEIAVMGAEAAVKMLYRKS